MYAYSVCVWNSQFNLYKKKRIKMQVQIWTLPTYNIHYQREKYNNIHKLVMPIMYYKKKLHFDDSLRLF